MTTLFIGQNHIELTEVDSTNDYASSLLKRQNLMEGTVISTLNQTKGKGQRGKQWLSEPSSNLIFSVVLYPNFLSADRQFELNKIISTAIAAFISQYIPSKKLSIKWPNDIYVGNLKIAGILIENNVRNNLIQSSVIGIGCNINQTKFDGAITNPTSIKLETGKENSLQSCIATICSFIEAKYLYLRNNTNSFINDEYEKLLYKRNEIVDFKKANGDLLKGIIRGVNKNGMLMIENETGQISSFSNGEITMVIPAT